MNAAHRVVKLQTFCHAAEQSLHPMATYQLARNTTRLRSVMSTGITRRHN